jgi:hypothetical protein
LRRRLVLRGVSASSRIGGGSDDVVGGGLAAGGVSVVTRMADAATGPGWQTGMMWLRSGEGAGRQIPVGSGVGRQCVVEA